MGYYNWTHRSLTNSAHFILIFQHSLFLKEGYNLENPREPEIQAFGDRRRPDSIVDAGVGRKLVRETHLVFRTAPAGLDLIRAGAVGVGVDYTTAS